MILGWPTWASPWEYTTADWAGLQFAVLVAAAYFALRQAGEARRLREERARPHVLIDLVVWTTIAEFKITNIGPTLARNIRFRFDPPLVSSRDSEPTTTALAETNLFKKGIPSLAPGREVVALFDVLPQRVGRDDLPEDYEVTVSYTDTLGKPYSEKMTVGYSYLSGVGRITRHDIHDLYKKVDDMSREMKRWTVLGHALQVMTPTDIKAYHQERTEEWEKERAENEAEAERAANAKATGDQVEQLGPDGRVAPTAPDDPE